MWADNETSLDLLGFKVHEHLIRNLVTQETLLPITVGVFGDWGGGKSSVLRMLQQELETDEYEDIACLYFNGWVFEGYDDAKAALLSSILIQLGEHRRFGPKIRHRVIELLKLVDFMRLAGLSVKYGAPAVIGLATASGLLDPSMAAGLGLAAAATATNPVGESPSLTEEGSAKSLPGLAAASEAASVIDWQALIGKDRKSTGPLNIRQFRQKFEELLDETGLRALVIVIDDLDRCEPGRLVENLEAIKLFLAVPKTAFVIAADEWIVRHSISVRYGTIALREGQSSQEVPRDLATDYLEKLIQVPYHLPRLSPSEVESYITLLFCDLHLEEDELFDRVLFHFEAERERNFYATYGAGSVRGALGKDLPDVLDQQLRWIGGIAPRLAEGLKGNPRQVKRFLNALLLRRQLGEIAKLGLRDDVLVKLMLLEYTHFKLFDQLYEWQAVAEGRPEELTALEEAAVAAAANGDAGSLPEGASAQWQGRSAQAWLRLEPRLGAGAIDLRDYYWVARDRLQSTISGLSMLSPFVREIFEQLVSGNVAEHQSAIAKLQELRSDDRAMLLGLLGQRLAQHPHEPTTVEGFMALVEAQIEGSSEGFIDALSVLPATEVEPDIAFELQRVAQLQADQTPSVTDLLTKWSTASSSIGPAAKSALRDLAAGAER